MLRSKDVIQCTGKNGDIAEKHDHC